MASSVCVLTYGCQMNEADSLTLEERLALAGYVLVDVPDNAQAVVLNTCSVRRKAEERIFGQLGHLKALKQKRPGMVIGVIGCMARAARAEIEQRTPFVDFICGPDEFDGVVGQLLSRLDPGSPEEHRGALPGDPFPFKRYLPIARGCDNYCSYCIVPYCRGPERSVPVDSVFRQLGRFADSGVLEVTFLGQNVNSYKSGPVDFPGLLAGAASSFPDIGFRFLTSHPKDVSHSLIEVMGRFDNVLPWLHLPMQAGADRILELMNRGYTIGHYLERVHALRAAKPDLCLTTDIICGFPGETDAEFAETLDAVREIRFDSAFMFYYSPRPGTKAASLPGLLPDEQRKARLKELIALQQGISREVNRKHVGQVYPVLIEKTSRRSPRLMAARTPGNKTVLVSADGSLIGSRRLVRVESADAWTLTGTLVKSDESR